MRQNRPKNKSYKKDKEGHYTMIKGLIQDKDLLKQMHSVQEHLHM